MDLKLYKHDIHTTTRIFVLYMISKAKRFEREQQAIVNKIVNILDLRNNPIYILHDMDQNISMQDQIIELSSEIQTVYNCNNLKAITDPTRIKRPWLSIIKTLLKPHYQIIVDDYNKKVKDGYIHTKKYTFIHMVV